jgi:hypothetical protein
MSSLMLFKRKEAHRVTDEPSYLLPTFRNGFVPRDYFNLELRHHQMLFIVFIVLSSFVFNLRMQNYEISLNLQIFCCFFCILLKKNNKSLHFMRIITIFAIDKPFVTICLQDLSLYDEVGSVLHQPLFMKTGRRLTSLFLLLYLPADG